MAELGAKLTRLMAAWGFRERRKSGSISWIARSGGRYETVFKLVHAGGGAMLFGVNRAVAERNQRLRGITWPARFAVAPRNQLQFLGFRVSDANASLRRVGRLLLAFGKPDAALGPSPEQEEADRKFDEQLESLTEDQILAASSMAAAAAVLPAEDFSDWEGAGRTVRRVP